MSALDSSGLTSRADRDTGEWAAAQNDENTSEPDRPPGGSRDGYEDHNPQLISERRPSPCYVLW